MSNKSYREESLFINFNGTDRLHLRRFWSDEQGIPVMLMHGSIENGRIFYSASGKGLAPFLARHGYDVFVPDLRGRGLSTPPVKRHASYGVFESITEEIPSFLNLIAEIKGHRPMHWMAHSWGGILLLCHFARFQPAGSPVLSMTFFGTKRRISIFSVKKLLLANGVYGFLFPVIGKLKGFVDVKMLLSRSDNESVKTNRQTWDWVRKKDWIEEDGFNYRQALNKVMLPPVYYLAGAADDVLGHPKDVQALIKETGIHQMSRFSLLSKQHGNLHNYDHISLLTHPDAVRDHFQEVLTWMKQHE